MLSLDIVIPTHNRSALLQRLLESMAEMRIPDECRISTIVVGNACTDQSAEAVRSFAQTVAFPVVWIEESTLGKSSALNAGIAASHGDWIAFFDDDERVDPDWLEVFVKEWRKHRFDFCAGRYRPDFEIPMPDWVPEQFAHAALTFHPEHLESQPLSFDAAILYGGNCVIARSALNTVGGFDHAFARTTGVKALGCEDSDMQFRLLEAGYVGWYLRDLCISHWTPASRLSKAHFRNWVFWGNYSLTQYWMLRSDRAPARRLFGLERWQFRVALRAAANLIFAWTTLRHERVRMLHELRLRSFAGQVRAVWEGRSHPTY